MKKGNMAAAFVVGCLVSCGAIGQASASSIIGNFTGTTGNLTGVFQNVDGSLVSNMAVTGSFSLDLDVPFTSRELNVPDPDQLYRHSFPTGLSFLITIGTHVFSFNVPALVQQRTRGAGDDLVVIQGREDIGTMFNGPSIVVEAPDLFSNIADPRTIHIAGLTGSLGLISAEGNGGTGDTIYADWRIPLDNVSIEVAAVPGPMVGAGLPGLAMALGGLLAWRRRRVAAA